MSGIFGNLNEGQLLKIAQDLLGAPAAPKVVGHSIHVRVLDPGDVIRFNCRYGGFELHHVSGPIAVSRGLWVHPIHRKQGWSGKFEEIKRAYCNLAEVKMLLATVNNDNAAQLTAIQSHGWTRVSDLGTVGLWATRLDGDNSDFCYLA